MVQFELCDVSTVGVKHAVMGFSIHSAAILLFCSLSVMY